MSTDLSYAALRRAVDAELAGFLDERRAAFVAMAPESARLVDLVADAVAGGGKRLRPLLCLGAFGAGGGDLAGNPAIVRAAASLELLHTFAILHDDVMDQAELRRGRPALHRTIAAERRAAGGGSDADVFGVSVAVLAGDLALVLADSLLGASGMDAPALARARAPVDAMRFEAIAGQYLDLFGAGALGSPDAGGPAGPEEAERIARLKTSGYSVEGPVATGAALAGAPGPVAEALHAYATAVGGAFALADELIGLFGDAATTGKDAESDLRRGKPTVLIARAHERGSPEDQATIRSRWGNTRAGADDLSQVRAAVERSGARAEAEAGVAVALDRASLALKSAGLAETGGGQLLATLAAAVATQLPPA